MKEQKIEISYPNYATVDTDKRKHFPKTAYEDLRIRPSDTLARELSEGDMNGEKMDLPTNEITEGEGAVYQQMTDGGEGTKMINEEPFSKPQTEQVESQKIIGGNQDAELTGYCELTEESQPRGQNSW